MILSEVVVLPNIKLSTNQKWILILLYLSNTPSSGYVDTSPNQHKITARQQLASMGLVEVDLKSKTAAVTDKGIAVMKDENLIDDHDISQLGLSIINKTVAAKKVTPPGGLPSK